MKLDSYLLTVASFMRGTEERGRGQEETKEGEREGNKKKREENISVIFPSFYNDLTLTTTLKVSTKTLTLEVIASIYQYRRETIFSMMLCLSVNCVIHINEFLPPGTTAPKALSKFSINPSPKFH